MQETTYRKLILDTYSSTKVLQQIELGLLDQILAAYRVGLFDEGQNAVHSIRSLIDKELPELSPDTFLCKLLERQYNGSTERLASDIEKMLQITIEFMDKSLKGLLTGDLSILALRQIQLAIENHLKAMSDIQLKIEESLKDEAQNFFNENFRIKKESYMLNAP